MEIIIALLTAIATAFIFLTYAVRDLSKTSFKLHGRLEVSLLRLEYYSQKNRTPKKDAAFECKLQEVEIKYGLR